MNLQKVNYQFYNLLVKSLGNKRLYEIYLNVAKQIRWTTHLSLGIPGRPRQSNREHREIFEKFAIGDEIGVYELTEKHGKFLMKRVFTALKEKTKN